MKSTVKLPLIILFLYAGFASAQSGYTTKGKFSYQRALSIPTSYEIGPGQISKDGRKFILGLIDGGIEDMSDLHSDLYFYDLAPSASALPITACNLNNPIDSMRLFQVSASDNDEHLVFVVNAYAGWNDNELGIADKKTDGSYSNIRLLTELNDPVVSDAYPWISGDAKRIYYSRNFQLMFAQRSSVDSAFSSPVPVDFIGDVQLEVVSVWLSPDEKNIFLIANNRIYKSTRKKTTDAFPLPTVFTDEFKDFYFISGLSFAPDKKSMYLYYSDEQQQQILQYQLTKGKAW